MLCNYISCIPVEKYSVHPLVGVQGQWIKCVAQGYTDRRGYNRGSKLGSSTWGMTWISSSHCVWMSETRDCTEKLLKQPHRIHLLYTKGDVEAHRWEKKPCSTFCSARFMHWIKVLPPAFVSIAVHKTRTSLPQRCICIEHFLTTVCSILYEQLPCVCIIDDWLARKTSVGYVWKM